MRRNCVALQLCILVIGVITWWNTSYARTVGTPPSIEFGPSELEVQTTRVSVQSRYARNNSTLTAVSTDSGSAQHCGPSLLREFGLQFAIRHDPSNFSFRIEITSGNTTDVYITARAIGQGVLVALRPVQSGKAFAISYNHLDSGRYEVEADVSWVNDHFVGQRWSLPNRNDDPPFSEMKRKCLALSLDGDGCGRYGFSLIQSSIFVRRRTRAASCTWTSADGRWAIASSPTPYLDDPVGLNKFQGQTYAWFPSGCTVSVNRSPAAVLHALQAHQVRRIALFGDSMLVEQFYMLHQFFAEGIKVVQSKHRRLRSLEFSTPELHVKFFRSYTTGGGHSIIAATGTIVEQLASFKPDAVVGNLAVLHWQQNMRQPSEWESNLQQFRAAFEKSATLRNARPFYLGPTLIHMGRTQGLQPQRTLAFAAAARRLLPRFQFVDLYDLSISRRESAFDGQHWACYHRFGGVAHTIMQLLLRHVATYLRTRPAGRVVRPFNSRARLTFVTRL